MHPFYLHLPFGRVVAALACVLALLWRLPIATAERQPGHTWAQTTGRYAAIAPLRTVPVGQHPALVAVDARDHRVFVADQGRLTGDRTLPIGPGSVAMVDERTGAVLHTVQVSQAPVALAVDAPTRRVFVLCTGHIDTVAGFVSRGGSLSVLDAMTGAVVRTLSVGPVPLHVSGSGAVPTARQSLVVDSTSGLVYVATSAKVLVLDGATGAVRRTITVRGGITPSVIAPSANAAASLNNALTQRGYTNYHIVTAGLAAPTASPYQSQCSDPSNFANNNYNNISIAAEAISDATNKGVPLSVLAAGVHPYHYNTPNDGTYWRNYYTEYPGYIGDGIFAYNTYAGPCGDLSQMLNTWLNSLDGVPVIFTEDNWTSNGGATPDCGSDPGCEGTYLADLFTYLYDSASYYTNPQASAIRVMIYRGADDGSAGHQLGIYQDGTTHKQIYLNACNNGAINNSQATIDNDYYQLRHAGCY